jgi:hypothetical protein
MSAWQCGHVVSLINATSEEISADQLAELVSVADILCFGIDGTLQVAFSLREK